MINDVYRVLLVEDDVHQASQILRQFRLDGHGQLEAIHVTSLAKAKQVLNDDTVDIIVLDLNLSDSFGIDTFLVLHNFKPNIPIVILSGNSDEEIAIACMRQGAQDYLVKGRDDGHHIVRTLLYSVERKRTDLQMQRMQSAVYLEHRMESIGALAGGIVHEINTPTQFVSANLEFIAKAFDKLHEVLGKCEKLIESDDNEIRRKAIRAELAASVSDPGYQYFKDELKQTILESIDGMGRICTMVRTMKSFMHNGEHKPVPYDVNQIISDAVNLSRNEWKYIASMNLELEENLPPLLCCPQELCQVFLNIIVNAVHAIAARYETGDSGTKRGDIGIHSCRDSEGIIVHVSDNGVGIPDEAKPRIFEPFYTTKTIGEGTGLGLSIVYSIIKKHKGKVTFESRTNQGTVFTLSFPLQASEQNIIKTDVA